MKSKKSLFVLCGIVLTVFLVIRWLNNDIRVVSLPKQQYQDTELEIIDGDNYIKYISNLNVIKDITWMNEEIVQFKGKNKNDDTFKVFQFDFNNKDFSLSKDSIETKLYNENDFKGKVEYTKKIDEDNYIIYIDGEGLFHIRKNKKPIILSNKVKLNDELLFKISDNKKKIAYYDFDEKSIVVYDLISNKKVKIEHEIDNEILNNFNNCINFSYEGGYVTIASINRENIKESNFSIYGADSGKMYVEKFVGINPVWGKSNLIIAFTYLEDNSIANTKDTKVENLVGDRIGFLNLKTRRIRYVQKMDKGYKIIKPPLWSNENEIVITVGKYSKEEKKYNFNKIYTYDIENDILINIGGYLKDINNIGNDFKIDSFGNYIYISSKNKEQENMIMAIDLMNRSQNQIRDIQEFMTDYEGEDKIITYKILGVNKFLYVKDNCIYLCDMKSNYKKFKSNGEITYIYESPNNSSLFIISKYGENLELSIIDI